MHYLIMLMSENEVREIVLSSFKEVQTHFPITAGLNLIGFHIHVYQAVGEPPGENENEHQQEI